MIKLFVYFFVMLLCFSCNENKYIKTYKLPKFEPVVNDMKLPKSDTDKPFSWVVPDSWIPGNMSSMRLASFNAPYDEGVADISITNFSGDGGGLMANVNRWRKQLGLEPQTEEFINKSFVIKESKLGTYKLIKIKNDSNPDSAFLCSVIEIKNSTIFIKMKASILGINQLEKEFVDFCSSFK